MCNAIYWLPCTRLSPKFAQYNRKEEWPVVLFYIFIKCDYQYLSELINFVSLTEEAQNSITKLVFVSEKEEEKMW